MVIMRVGNILYCMAGDFSRVKKFHYFREFFIIAKVHSHEIFSCAYSMAGNCESLFAKKHDFCLIR